MSSEKFPYIAIVLGVMFYIALFLGGQTHADGSTHLPLLTLLLVSEFGFISHLAALYIVIKKCLRIGINVELLVTASCCIIFIGYFLIAGLKFWPS